MAESRRFKRYRAFTLVELLLVVAISAMIAVFAIPSFKAMFEQWALVDAGYQLQHAFNQARTMAIDANRFVTLCPTTDNDACENHNAWNSEVIMFYDDDGNGSRNTASGSTETIIRVFSVSQQPDFLTISKNTNGNFVRYRKLGSLSGIGFTMRASQVSNPSDAVCVIVSSLGRSRIDDPC